MFLKIIYVVKRNPFQHRYRDFHFTFWFALPPLSPDFVHHRPWNLNPKIICSQSVVRDSWTIYSPSESPPTPVRFGVCFFLLLLFFVFCFCIIKNVQWFDTIPKWKIIFTDINSNVVLCLHQAQSSLLFPRPTNTSEKMHLHEMQCMIITFAYIKL